MANLTNKNIATLLQTFQPVFFFDPTEQFFPSVAEEVLNHQSTEKWTNQAAHERGTAVFVTPLTATSYSAGNVKAGVDAPNGAPLTFDATPPNGIGQPFPYNPEEVDLFIDCAGWNDTSSAVPAGGVSYTTGSVEYLQQLFSGLGNAMNSAIPVTHPHPLPKFDFPRSQVPTIYAELEWAGRYPQLDQDRIDQYGGSADFPPSLGSTGNPVPGPFQGLNDYLALTYYLFYPAMEISPAAPADPSVNRIREGQWEAITVFLKGDPNMDVLDPQGRPDFYSLNVDRLRGLTPKFVTYSQGYSLGDDNFNPLAAEVRPWLGTAAPIQPSVILTWNTHPIAYVTAGTHRNLFSIDATVTTGPSQPDPALNTTGGGAMGAGGSLAGLCLGLMPPPLTPGAIACLLVAGLIFLIGLILFVLSFLLPQTSPPSESPQSSQPGSDVARDNGPAAFPSLPGGPISGTSTVVQPTLRLISQYGFDPTPPITSYPLPSPLPASGIEMPSWWNFPGRWGVRVTPTAAGQWDSGSRRTDQFGRSRGYWNAYQLVQFVASSGDGMSL